MRIGFIAHEIALPGSYGGVGRYLRDIGSAMVDAGHEVFALLPGVRYSRAEAYGMRIQYVPVAQRDFATALAEPAVELAALAWLEAVRPDVVHVQHLFGLSPRIVTLFEARGVPVVLHMHDGAPFCTQAHFHRWDDAGHVEPCGVTAATDHCADQLATRYDVEPASARRYVDAWRADWREAFAAASEIVYVSTWLQELFEEQLGWRVRSSRVLPPALAWPEPALDAPHEHSGTVFGAFGLQTPIKGLDRLLDAFERIRGVDARIELHGSVMTQLPGMAALQRRLNSMPRVVQRGAYEPTELAQRLAGVDWVVIPSHYESSPLVLDEARACGIPAIVANVGGIPEKLGAGGIVVDASDPEAFAAALRMACDPQVCAEKSAHMTPPPTIASQVAELTDIYERVRASSSTDTVPDPDGMSVVVVGWSEAELSPAVRKIAIELEQTDELLPVQVPVGESSARHVSHTLAAASHERTVLLDAATILAPDWSWERPTLDGAAPYRAAATADRGATIPVWHVAGGVGAWIEDIRAGAGFAAAELPAGIVFDPPTTPVSERIARRAIAPVAAQPQTDDLTARGLVPGLTSIVILTVNGLAMTQACVESIERATPEPHEYVFVDNGSTDGTLEYLRSLPNARVVANPDNLGFGAGCNQGMARARGERILLLNNDTVVTPGWLGALHAALDSDPRVGIAGPRSNRVADAQQFPIIGYDDEPDAEMEGWAARVCARRAGHRTALGRVVGFCMLMRREVVDAIGGFDLRFGAGNFEDDDICVRAGIAGFDSLACDDAFVHHLGSRTFLGLGLDHSSKMTENFLRFAEKWDLAIPMDGSAPTSYSAVMPITRTRYSLERCYEPLTPYAMRDADIEFERKHRAVLIAATPGDVDELTRAFTWACEKWSAADDVTVVVRVALDDDAAFTALESVAAGYADDELVDVTVLEAAPCDDLAAARACDDLIVAADLPTAQFGLAARAGAHVLTIDSGERPEALAAA